MRSTRRDSRKSQRHRPGERGAGSTRARRARGRAGRSAGEALQAGRSSGHGGAPGCSSRAECAKQGSDGGSGTEGDRPRSHQRDHLCPRGPRRALTGHAQISRAIFSGAGGGAVAAGRERNAGLSRDHTALLLRGGIPRSTDACCRNTSNLWVSQRPPRIAGDQSRHTISCLLNESRRSAAA